MLVTSIIVIAVAPRRKVSYPGIVRFQPDGLSICICVENYEHCASDDKRDESHLEFCKQQGIQ